MGTVRFGNDHFAAITRYGDYAQGNLMIGHVYYVEGLGHNLFLVEQFCDGDLEVAFCSNTCYVRNLKGDDLLTEYYTTSPPEVSDNFAAQTLDNNDTSSSSSIVIEEDEAPQIVSSSIEQVEPNTPVLNENADEVVQEDVAEFDGNFHQTHRSTDKWTKNHPIEQVIGDLSKPVMTRLQLHTDAEVCMYALTVSTTEPKNIKEAMLDASWIESMQDELNQFKRLDVWELIECPIGRNIITVKWI
ncbi:hypothetical protein Tco_0903389 [Tanacetum coccineum]